MIIASKTRYVPTAVNMVILQGEDGMYYYLHRSTYDQCVILRDQYIHLLPSFYKLLGLEEGHPAVCDEFMEKAPEPLDILGPFLSLITGCEELDNMEDMCGALSSMSMTVSFRNMFKVPAAVRQSIKFSLTVREEYRIQWDRFFLETPTLEQVSFVPVPVSERPAASATSQVVLDDDDGELQEVTFVGDGSYDMDDLLGQLDQASAGSGSSGGDSRDEDEDEDEPEVPKGKSGFDMLRGLK